MITLIDLSIYLILMGALGVVSLYAIPFVFFMIYKLLGGKRKYKSYIKFMMKRIGDI